VARTQSVEDKAVNKAGLALLALLSIVAAVHRTSLRRKDVAVHRSLHTGKREENADRAAKSDREQYAHRSYIAQEAQRHYASYQEVSGRETGVLPSKLSGYFLA